MKYKYKVNGMSCASCAAHVAKCAERIKSISDVDVSLINNTITFTSSLDCYDALDILLRKEGYSLGKSRNVNYIKRFIATLILVCFSMTLSMGSSIHIISLIPTIVKLILLFVFSTSSIIINYDVVLNGFKRLINLKPDMNSLVFIGVFASFIYSLVYSIIYIINKDINILNHLYLDSISMILCFLNIGKAVEKASVSKANNFLNNLDKVIPKTVFVERNGERSEISLEDVLLGDIFTLSAGDIVPVDSVILKGRVEVDESSNLLSGSTIYNGTAVCKAVKTYKESTYEYITNLVVSSSLSKAKAQRIADKISSIFVPIIFALATLTFMLHIFISKDFESSLMFFISTLVVACPCALGLATPIAVAIASNICYKKGIIFRNINSLENASNIKNIVFDKTGTLTEYLLDVSIVDGKDDNDTLSIIYSLEKDQKGPQALSIAEYCKANNAHAVELEEVSYDIGYGVSGTYNNTKYYLGSNIFAKKLFNFDLEEGFIYLFINSHVITKILLKEKIKDESYDLINSLSKYNISILSGDSDSKTKEISNLLKISKYYSFATPENKINIIKELNINNDLMMVGDGLNDSASLKEATIGITFSSGSDLSKLSCDIILYKNDIKSIKDLLVISKKLKRTITINLLWALIYNLFTVSIAMGVFESIGLLISPMIASILMSISSIFVCLNSLSLLITKKEKNKMIDIKVEGMMCEHCEHHVEQACISTGCISAKANHKKNVVCVELGRANIEKVKEAISKAGYKA